MPSVQQRLEILISAMTEAGYENFRMQRVVKLVNELQQSSVNGVPTFIRLLTQRVAKRQEFLDIFVEGQFCEILAKNGFSQIYIECCREGPDIKANYNRQTVYFEVTRRNPDKEQDSWEKLETRSGSSDSLEYIIERIRGELGHFPNGERNIVVYWSSSIRSSSVEVREAFRYIGREIDENPQVYHKLSAILFTEALGFDVQTLKEFYLFKNDKASKPLGNSLSRKLESLCSLPLGERQRVREHLLQPTHNRKGVERNETSHLNP